jgi:Tol biopolymer transport system component
MKRFTIIVVTAVMLAAGLAAVRAQGDTATEKLFASAQHKAAVDGDLKGAISEYLQVAAHAGPNRTLAAKALLAAGECYREMGDGEARKLFERVVNEYPDQKDAVAAASLRLEDPNAAKIPVQRQVWTGSKVDVYGSISPDGRLLSFVDWANHGALAIHDFTTGEDRPVESGGEAEYSTISKDGRLVAYSWLKRDVGRYVVRLANLTGEPKPRPLFDNPEVGDIEPYDWTPDGKWIAVGIKRADRTAQIGLLSAENGKLTVLKSADWRGSTRMFFSPDGQYLAYDMPARDGDAQRDVYVIAVDGSKEIAAVVDPNQDIVMGWARGLLLFASDRSGSMGLWALPFQDGKVLGDAERLKADLGTFESSLGISNSGALFFGGTGISRNVEIAGIDWNTGRLTGPPADLIKTFVGHNGSPSWSRDGRYLGYRSLRSPTMVLAVVNVESGKVEREIRPRMSFIGGAAAHLSPDARTFVVDGTDLKGRNGVFVLAPDTGDATPVAVSDDPDQVSNSDWSADGKKIYYLKIAGNRAWRAFIEKDLASGAERELLRSWGLGSIRVSPDGKWIAMVKADSADSLKAAVAIPATGAPVIKELYRAKKGEDVLIAGWTPAGEALVGILPVSPAKPAGSGELWAMPPDEGRAARKLESSFGGLLTVPQLMVSPDGRYIAFLKNGPSISEVSVLENFLPKTGGK